MSTKKDFFSGIASKLTILMGGAALMVGTPGSAATPTAPAQNANAMSLDVQNVRKPLPAKLTLKQQWSGFKLIAAHGSHSSHSSHSSPSSRAA